MQMAFERRSRVNVKLLSFLKKTLPEREYRCLYFESCEPCMVETEEENRVQKHVFCTSNRLYVVDSGLKTEPKALCSLEDILQVRKTDNLPSFLSRKDAEGTVHVQVVYQGRVVESKATSVMMKSPAFLKRLFGADRKQTASYTDSLSSSGDLEELYGDQQSPLGGSSMLVPSTLKGEQARFRQTSSQELHVCVGSLESSSNKAVPLAVDSSQSTTSNVKGSPLHTLRSSTPATTSEPRQLIEKSPLQSLPEPNITRREKQKTSPLCLNNMASLQAAMYRDEPSVAMQTPSVAMHGQSVAMHRPPGAMRGPSVAMRGPSVAMRGPSVAMRGPSITVHGDSLPHENSQRQVTEVQKVHRNLKPDGRGPLMDGVAMSSWKSASSLPLAILHDSSPRRSHSMDFDKTAGQDAPSPGILQKGPRSMLSIESIRSQASSTPEGSPICLRKITAELYILNRRSHFHHHLLLAWERRLLSLTWLMGDTAVLPSLEMQPQEKLRANYQKLQYEVFCCAECLEGTAELLQELATACQKYEEICRFFWEDSTVLTACCRLLQEHLPPMVAMATTGQRPIHRADQLELSILAMTVLYHMSRGSTCAAERLKQLASERGQSMLSIQSAAMAPLTDRREQQPTSEAQKDEIQKLCWEATDTSASVLSELALVSQQQWRAEGPHRPTPSWFAEAIALHNNSVGYFSRLVARCSCLLRSKELAPEEVVTVYHIVHLMLFSCSNNADVLKRCRKSFKEEVRYYLRLSVCQSIIADHVPLKQRTLQLLKELKSLLLEPLSS